jgi:PhzF family phenazine biosynthesis protein
MPSPDILHYAAFTHRGRGGNPAGVVLDARGLDAAARLSIAAELGYSESAFVEPGAAPREYRVQYFSPLAEVPFCGHATVALAVALADRDGAGRLELDTRAGRIEVETRAAPGQPTTATLTSVPTRSAPVDAETLAAALHALNWTEAELDPALPPRVAYAGAHHLVLAARTRERLARLHYDFEALGALMAVQDWTTVHLVFAFGPETYSVRDPFPPGGVVEDPATGAAALAFGGYLRDLGLVERPARIELIQGEELGAPSRLVVDVPLEGDWVQVTGAASLLRA